MLGNHKGFCSLFSDYNINSNLLQKEVVDIEKSAQLHKINVSRGGKKTLKSNAKSLINDDLADRNQVTKDMISD